MFLVTNFNASFLSQLKKIEVPITKLVNHTNKIATPIKNFYYRPQLKTLNKAVKESFNEKPTFFVSSSSIDKIQNEKLAKTTTIFSLANSANLDSSSSIDSNENKNLFYQADAILTQKIKKLSVNNYNKVSYRYKHDKLKTQHKVTKFQLENNDKPTINGLVAYFLHDKYDFKVKKIFGSQNLKFNQEEIFNILDPSKTNSLTINNLNLLDESLALTLAKNKQRILLNNGSNLFVLIPRLEKNPVTKLHEVFWSVVDEKNNYYTKSNDLKKYNPLFGQNNSAPNLTLKQVLTQLKHKDTCIKLLISKPNISNTKYILDATHNLEYKINLAHKKNVYQGLTKYSNLLEAVSDMFGKNPSEFINNNPQAARKLLTPFRSKFNLKHILDTTGEHAYKYDLNLVYDNQFTDNHKQRKNGKTIIDNVINPAIKNNQSLLLHIKPNLINLNSQKEDYISFQCVEQKWYMISLSGLFASQKIDAKDIHTHIKHLTKQAKVELYHKPLHDFTRAEWRFKGKVPIGTSANALHAKLSTHKKTWKGDKQESETYDRAEKALLNAWNGHEIRAKTIEYKQTKKPKQNFLTRVVNSYINPLSFEHRQGWKAGKTERKAKFDGEDSFRRIKGNMIEGGFQSLDNSLAYIITMAASDTNLYGPINHDNTVLWGTHMATCTPLQLLADAIGVTSSNAKAKNGHLFSLSMKNTVNDISRQAKHATQKNDLDLKLFEQITNNFNNQNTEFNIDGKLVKIEEAKTLMAQKLIENIALAQNLIMQHKAQNKMTIAFAGFGQFFQNIVRMAIIFANVFLPAVSIPAAKLTRLIRMAIQPIAGGIDGLIQKEYLMRYEVNHPAHKMTNQALEYGLDKVIDTLNAKDFETHIINIMLKYGHADKTLEQINAMPSQDKKLFLAQFVFDAQKIHDSVSYNAERRAGEVSKYFTEKFAQYDELRKTYALEPNSQHKINLLNQKEQAISEQAILFNQGLQYIEAKNSNPIKDVPNAWQYAWGTLQRNYPKSRVVKLLQVDSPEASVNYTFKQLMKDPAEVLQHTLFRGAFMFWGLDEVGYAISNLTEHNGGGETAQKIAVSAWYSQVFASATIGGVASYLEHVNTYGRPAWHESYVSAFILRLRQEISKKNYEINLLQQKLFSLNPSAKNYSLIQHKIQHLSQLNLLIQKQQQLLEHDIKPTKAISDLAKADKLFLFADNTAQEINLENLQNYSAEFLASSMASLIPKDNSKLHNRLNTDRSWLQKAQKNANLWVKGESIFSSPLEKLKLAFKSQQAKQQELDITIQQAHQQLESYSHDIKKNFNNNYKDWLEYLYNQIPNGTNIGKADHAINRSLFLQKLQDILEQINIESKNLNQEMQELQVLGLGQNIELEQINLKLNNFTSLTTALTQFIDQYKNQAPTRIKYLNINDITTNEQGTILTNTAKLSQDKNAGNNITINLHSSVHYNNRQHLTTKRKALDTKWRKVKYTAKSVGLFTYQRILNPFGRKSWSKYAINVGYRHWLPYMIVRQAIILPITLAENIAKSYYINKLKYSLQKTQNSPALQTYTNNQLHNLAARITHIQQDLLNENLTDEVKNKLKKNLYTLSIEKENLIANTAQLFTPNDSLINKLNFKKSNFNLNTQNFIQHREALLKI